MARDKTEISVGYAEVVELTNAVTSKASFQVDLGKVEIIVLNDGVSVTDSMSGWSYSQGEGELNKNLSEFAGTVTGDGRVWARGKGTAGSVVTVDHA